MEPPCWTSSPISPSSTTTAASCYSGIKVEMAILNRDEGDQNASDRMIGYYSRICDELENTFGHTKAFTIREHELSRKSYYLREGEYVAADVNMSVFLVQHYKEFCKSRQLSNEQEEAESHT